LTITNATICALCFPIEISASGNGRDRPHPDLPPNLVHKPKKEKKAKPDKPKSTKPKYSKGFDDADWWYRGSSEREE
jgi:hypothetical protein